MLHEILAYWYGRATSSRNWLYDHSYFNIQFAGIPVLSLGNITCGGSGKTPLSMHLAQELQRLHYRPVLLAKGYKGSIRGPHQVAASDSFASVGDEGCLMYRRSNCPVVVSKDKTAGARYIADTGLGDIIILDDGFQHRRLARDVNVLCIDASSSRSIDLFVEGRLLPAGPFREAREPAIHRADIIVVSFRRMLNIRLSPPQKLLALLPQQAPLFLSAYALELGRSVEDASVLNPCKVIACCALANPEGFFESFGRLGYEVAKTYAFADHDPGFAAKIVEARRAHPGLPVLCTEKDAVKLTGDSAKGVYYTPLQVKLFHERNASFAAAVVNLMQDRTPLPDGACRLIGRQKKALHLERVVIESERIVLKPVSQEYIEDIFREFTQEIATYMMPRPARDISETHAFVQLCQSRLLDGRDLTMMILKKDSGEFLGCCGLHERNDVIHPELGIWVKKSAHGHGYGFEAVRALKNWTEANLRYEYLIYPVDRRNIPSRRIPEKLGGVIFQEKVESTMWGGILDEVVYRIPYPVNLSS